MAERKPRTEILRRDPKFTQRIERRQSYANAFDLPNSEPEAPKDSAVIVDDDAPRKREPGHPKSASTEGRSAAPRQRRSMKTTTVEPEMATPEVLRISFTLPKEIVERAERRAAVAKCSPRQVVLAALNEMRPQLIEDLRNVKFEQITRGRQENSGLRVTTTWHINADLMKIISDELDPAGMGQVNSLVGYWIRAHLLNSLPDYLARFGA